MARSPLPIDDVLPKLLADMRARGAVVLKAPPGAGKTTRVPPAMLDAGLAQLDGNKPGRIILLQPRRVAARASAARIAEERGGEVGDEIGYQVRFERRASAKTRILVCTEGVFLRQLQNDPFLEGVAAVVFDEFHERSLDSDLALAMVRRVREEVRPDLRVVVMSATLSAAPIARYLGDQHPGKGGDVPTVESLGRTFPVDVEYLRLPSNDSIERLVVDGVRRMLTRLQGDVLVFLPGVGEINRVQDDLSGDAEAGNFSLLPLYGDMPLEEQQRVLKPTQRRKVVLATNVAETSLTIDGVTGVVDSGWARVNQYDAQLGLNRLDTVRISRASAEQRAGRAGRTMAGICFRLWTEREQNSLRDFERPEIERVDLSEAILQLLAWGETDVRAFPWYEPPPAAAVDQALALLDAIDALSEGKVTELGQNLAKLPLQPRLARLLLEGDRLGAGDRAALAAAMLSERDPFRRRGPRFKAEHHTDSDTLDRLAALEGFDSSNKQGGGRRDSQVGELLIGPAKQMLRARDQLLRSLDGNTKKSNVDTDDAVLRALAVAFPDRICKRREPKGRRGVMVGGRGVRLADESAVADAELFVAVELTESGQAETLVRQASLVERAWLPETHLKTSIEVAFDVPREKVMGARRTKFLDLVLDETPAAIPRDVDCGPILAAAVAERYDPTQFIDDDARRYLARLRCLREWLPQLEWPDFGPAADNGIWREILPEWCAGLASVADLKSHSPIPMLQARLTSQQLAAVERDAPERIAVPSGSRITLEYEVGKPPILAVRIQELFGLKETPRVGGGRIPVLLHLLAPNYRVQQITPDLASFWKNTYDEVKKELKRRYPKHAWPDDPTMAQAIAGPVKRRPQ